MTSSTPSAKDLILPLLAAVGGLFNIPCSISAPGNHESNTFEAIQLSAQGGERQRKDVMKLAATFEKLIAERRKEEKYRDVSVADILGELVKDYNSYKANAALKRWQLTPDQQSAISGVINGMSAEARQLVRQHLDFNKYDESGYNESLLRSKRHQLHEVPKGIPPSWIDRLTVTHDSQTLHFKRYNQWWASNAKRVKKSARARLRWGEEQWGKSVDQCCLVVWAIRERSKNPKVAQQTSLNNIHFVVLLRDVVNVCVLFVPLASKGHFRHA
ncbi:unnamed protein product [Durusdinium trenchii]|uniref:Uncharacterized protein n=1 Tax=Durusdinium trenchii TaxID=1381693 RepID=A0ABP0NWQ6_9DINO